MQRLDQNEKRILKVTLPAPAPRLVTLRIPRADGSTTESVGDRWRRIWVRRVGHVSHDKRNGVLVLCYATGTDRAWVARAMLGILTTTEGAVDGVMRACDQAIEAQFNP